MTFARFMDLALTHPEAGYYTRAMRVLGEGGDFITAPHKAPAFNRAVAGLLADIAQAADRPVMIIELGAGEGDLAAGVLGFWAETSPSLRSRVGYRLVDLSPGLRGRQSAAVLPFQERGWDVEVAATGGGASRPAADGRYAIILMNEFLDALPVHVVDVTGDRPREAWVRALPSGGGHVPVEEWDALSPAAEGELRRLCGSIEASALRRLTRDGRIELRPAVGTLLGRWVGGCPDRGLVTFDYGEWFLGPEEERPAEGVPRAQEERLAREPPMDRHPPYAETRRGYFRHQLTRNPLIRVGRQDLTADVDFRALDLHGRECGLETVVYTNMAAFLKGMGAGDELERLRLEARCSLEADAAAAVLGALMDGAAVGGAFKLMLQVTA